MNATNHFDVYQNGIESGTSMSVFRKKTERINWKLLAGVDIEKVIQQNDIPVLKENIKHLAFCDIESELDLRINDKNLVKMFKLTQLMVDYLLSSLEYLGNNLNTAEERGQVLIEEADTAKRKLQENEAYISDIKKECHRRKKLILAQQQIMDSGPNAYHRCPYCEKAFLNGTFLQAHLEKRHADRYIKDWYISENQRRKSPKREHSEEHPVHNDKTLELILQKLMEQRSQSPKQQRNNDEDLRRLANEFDQERREWQLAMRRMQNEIEDLKNQLNQANQKPRSYLKNLEDDISTKDDIERARQKAIEDHRKKPIFVPEEPIVKERVKVPKKKNDERKLSNSFEDRLSQKTNINEAHERCNYTDETDKESLGKIPNISKLSAKMDSIYSNGFLTNNKIDELGNISFSANEIHRPIRMTNNNDQSIIDSPDVSIDSFDTSAYTESLALTFQSSSNCSSHLLLGRGQVIVNPSPPELHKEKHRVESPIQISPRQTVSSPVHRNNIEKELPIRDSFIKTSNIVIESLDNLDNLGIDFTQDLIEKFCNEVRHMLDDHLELHGIQRGTTGISGAVLDDKMKIMDHDQSQLKLKYPNYAQIRKRLEAEIEQEAARRMLTGTVKPQTKTHSTENRIPERVKPQLSSRSLHSSQSEWDEISSGKPTVQKPFSPVRFQPQNRTIENDYKKAMEHQMRDRSPSPSPTKKNNLHGSSDLSNSIDSSAWQTESKAVTSVAHPGQGSKPILTNKSSDYDDESTFSK